QTLRLRFRDAATRDKASATIAEQFPVLSQVRRDDGQDQLIVATLEPKALKNEQDSAIKQNILTLGRRVNQLGVAEPVIQQQGADRIVVQLPGVQDTTKAKDILGRTATLEVRLVDEDAMRSGSSFNVDVFPERKRDGSVSSVPTKKQVLVTGDQFVGAQATFDQDQRPAVSVELNDAGGRAMRQATRENLKRLMAIVLIEKGKGEAISVATIQSEFGARFQITGMFTPAETNELSLLIRAGSLAAPMEIIEERTVGPSLGKENIEKGFNATKWGFIAIVLFMSLYYTLFGVFSSLALGVNLLFLVALLSLLQATLTLPGIAAIALTLGMAIDANVLINERIREEVRGGQSPQAAIAAGYERAWGTILDSNVTTLIAGLALLIFGSGPVRGFAVVHCLGIMTSIFSSVVVSRAIVNLSYGHRRRIIPFMRHALVFNIISLLTFFAAVFFLAHKGLHFSVEFTGGTLVEVNFKDAANVEAIRETLDKAGLKGEVQNFGSSRDVLIRLPVEKGQSTADLSQKVTTLLKVQDATAEVRRVEFVG